MPTVYIPSLMRDLTGGKDKISAEGATLRQIITDLENRYPGFRSRLIDEEEQRIRPNIAVMIDGRMARMGLYEKVEQGSELHFLPAISGG
jgi:MoaD family protein